MVAQCRAVPIRRLAGWVVCVHGSDEPHSAKRCRAQRTACAKKATPVHFRQHGTARLTASASLLYVTLCIGPSVHVRPWPCASHHDTPLCLLLRRCVAHGCANGVGHGAHDRVHVHQPGQRSLQPRCRIGGRGRPAGTARHARRITMCVPRASGPVASTAQRHPDQATDQARSGCAVRACMALQRRRRLALRL